MRLAKRLASNIVSLRAPFKPATCRWGEDLSRGCARTPACCARDAWLCRSLGGKKLLRCLSWAEEEPAQLAKELGLLEMSMKR